MTKSAYRNLLFGILTAFFAFGSYLNTMATHLRAGEIIVERQDCSSRTFTITIIAYTDCEVANPVLFGQGVLVFGDGSDPDGDGVPGIVVPETQNQERPDLGEGVCIATYTVQHVYSSVGTYVIGYVEPNRNEGVLNIDNSVNTTFYIETEINIDPFLGCNNSPQLLIPPIDKGCPGVAFFHNPGAFDPDGDSISFELVIPKQSVGTNVNGYEPLNDPSLYENFNQGNEDANGPPEFFIDPTTGEMTWNAPQIAGEYNIAFIVKEWRKIGGQYVEIGYVTRDMQIIVEDCDNERPELEIPPDICVEAGTLISEEIFGTDPDNDDVKIEAFSQVIQDFGASINPLPVPGSTNEYQSSVPQAVTTFTWQTECDHVREQPYQVVFKITDNPAEGPQLVSFETWNITVVGPAPDWNDPDAVTQDGQGLLLSWDTYSCQNAERLEIYRRVDTNPYTPDECETGIRENAGYELIETFEDVSINSYRDTDLAAAAKYCYRILAVFENPGGGESIVSEERCFEFVPAEEPVITHVSVEETDETNGEIVVSWREPFELGTLVAPYTFRIYRGTGFNGANSQVGELVTSNTDSASLSFVDQNLNTFDNAYVYRVAIVDASGSGGDEELFSAEASSVRLEPSPGFRRITLNWVADVPWSNTIVFPTSLTHEIYRGVEGEDQEDFQFLAEINTASLGFNYTDSANLDDNTVYCYRVRTKGSYGNPAVISPLLNWSQVVCAQPSDTIPPCPPVVSIIGNTCEDLIANGACSFSDVSNELIWETTFIGDCKDDIGVYELYYASTTESEFTLIAETRDTTFLHQNLPSFKGCYKVRAIDRSGNIGEFSETFCVDNCPNYVLPNIFTPGNADNCNDVFSAFGVERSVGEDGSTPCGPIDNSKCARFVRSVVFTVYNRWGAPVYTYRSGGENNIYINWDGTDDNGVELPSGVYFYLAEVTFDVVNPSQAKQDIKGWVHLLR